MFTIRFYYSECLHKYLQVYIYVSLLYFDLIKSVSSQACRTFSSVTFIASHSFVLILIHIHTSIHIRTHKSLLLLKLNALILDLKGIYIYWQTSGVCRVSVQKKIRLDFCLSDSHANQLIIFEKTFSSMSNMRSTY